MPSEDLSLGGHRLRAAVAIAHNTVLELVRTQILWIVVVFSALIVLLSTAAAAVNIGEQSRIILDVGSTAAHVLASMVSAGAAIVSFSGELHHRTAHTLLVRPISRTSLLLGKFLGVWCVGTGVGVSIFAIAAIATKIFGGSIPGAYMPGSLLLSLHLMMVVALALVFASIAVPVLAALYTGLVLIAGNLAQDLAQLARMWHEKDFLGAFALQGLYDLVPDLQTLSLRLEIANDLPVPDGLMRSASLYALVYTLCALSAAAVIFSRKKIL